MPSFAIRVLDNGELFPVEEPLRWHTDNGSFWTRVKEVSAQAVAIDGPCGTVGHKLREDRSGWSLASDDSKRPAEIEVNREGVNLFWTTRNSLENFDGASRWIARSLVLFEESTAIPKIETHPHGVFLLIHRALGLTDPLPKKNVAQGRSARFEILRALIPKLDPNTVPNHDALDAACAALMAALHQGGLSKGYGEESLGGKIWLPDVEHLRVRFNGRLFA
ncbi:MAG: DUF429 domain-containing protein [Candidatus Omnitrophica bacterium]|nr:DUF429 domain-containing protein [Candidatus Omnitrophota bacterium]